MLLFFSPITKKSEGFVLFVACYFLLLLVATLRFGIGTDYFNYYTIFSRFPATFSGITLKEFIGYQVEPGFLAVGILLKSLGMPFTYLIAICAFMAITLILYTIQNNSRQKMLSVFIFFANYYMVYIESALRQGIALGIFIYALYDFLKNKSKRKYYILILLGSVFHLSIIIALCVPIIVRIPLKTILNPIFLFCLAIISLSFSLVLPRFVIFLISHIFPRYDSYNDLFDINIMPIGLRLLELILVYILAKRNYNKFNQREIACVKIFIFGCLFYFSISSMSILSRLTEYFMFIEIILIPNIVSTLKTHENKSFRVVFSCLFMFLFFKDLNSFSYQGNFRSHRIIDYPYITIFNKDAIREIRPHSSYSSYFNKN
jgi:hypothetical protein